ncbi:L-glutaminase [Alkalithermobacter thermoalcaliphilus JW-YL-7 = DSM 7308]|uniref:Glutaminase n=1 Tax=Alkalithermobacter thermoalcaliphilus JW-YL-7 = DSM 7308 TaxID=1121328 RepID=A0A150FQ02_CLOPD|nr:Glutaminase [[Clostridium] paradoxum JW-YL-7 = DSM 7308]SHK84633.1 L-glutaminase [[Clostridium] paradoxum JW-YL-7 = DSM 7308]
MQDLLEKIIQENRKYTEKGNLATYIPELTKANKNDLAICVIDIENNVYKAGDYEKKFTIQSVSKPITLALALIDNGKENVFAKVGMEPSGDPFNSIMKLETVKPSIPYNPMINAGAIVITSMIKGKDNDEKLERMLNFFRSLSCNPTLNINEDVYNSEKRTGDRNRAIAYLLKSEGIIDGDVEEILDLYFKQCSIEVTVEDLARMGANLATYGFDMLHRQRIIPEDIARTVKTFMVTCGMYDASGEFAINVGIPSKSGVGGGIMSSVPKKMGIGVFGPALDKKGNSIAGIRVLKDISKQLSLSIF